MIRPAETGETGGETRATPRQISVSPQGVTGVTQNWLIPDIDRMAVAELRYRILDAFRGEHMAGPQPDERASGASPSGMANAPDTLHTNNPDLGTDLRRVLRVWQTATLPRTGRRVEYMRFGPDGLRPLVWLHSMEYPMSPPWGMCMDAAEAGFGIVSIRRPGFGHTSQVTAYEDEAALLDEFLDAAGIDNAVLIMEGSARPAGIRLAMNSPRIAYSIVAKPGYNNTGVDEEAPGWIANVLHQILQSEAGANLALSSFRNLGVKWLYGSFFSETHDQNFLQSHRKDIEEAWRCLRGIDAATLRRNVAFTQPDPLLVPGALKDFRGVAVIGADSPDNWRTGFLARSEELCIQTAILSKGCIFALHQNRMELLSLLRDID